MNTLRFFTTIAILGVSFSVRALPASAQLDRAYHYEAIDVVMTMNPDSTIDVEERQTFAFTGEFHEARRVIPIYKIDAITDVAVVDASTGVSLKKTIRKQDKLDPKSWGKYRVVTAKGNTTIQWFYAAEDEPRQWIIRYKVHGAVEFLQDQDRLYWNIFTSYEVPVSRATVRVNMPPGYEPGDAFFRAYRTNDLPVQRSEVSGQRAIVFSSSGFSSREDFTIDVKWQKGRIARSAYWVDFATLYYGYVIAILSAIVGALMIGMRWYWTEQRLIRKGAIIAQYEPPHHLPPAMMDVIAHEHVTDKGLTATIIDLAVRGYVKITEDSHKRFSWNSFMLMERNAGRILAVVAVFVMSMVALVWVVGIGWGTYMLIQEFWDHTAPAVVGLVTTCVPLLVLYAYWRHANNKRDYIVTLLRSIDDPALRAYEKKYLKILCKGGKPFSTLELAYASKSKRRGMYEAILSLKELIKKDTEDHTGAYAVGFAVQHKQEYARASLIIGGIVFYYCYQFLVSRTGPAQWMIAMGALIVAGVVVYTFFRYDARLSVEGTALKERVLGFRQYLYTAERYRLQNLAPDNFERYLPYAMVFGVEKQWAKAFTAIALTAPVWYVGNSGHSSMSGGFSSSAFSASFSSSFSSSVSSSGGGGGGAGGGGGGGGGGAS